MRTEKLNYDLPPELIAQKPLPSRSDSRLLVLNRSSGEILDSRFNRLGDFLRPGDCLVLNDTKVVPARFFAQRPTGGKLEGLFLSEDADGVWTAYLKGARKLKPGDEP
jgi:S-adenosylmethionine:tRNA ribosyltransferase-isomerase